MNLKTFVAPVAALTLAIGSATLSAPEAKAQRYYDGYQAQPHTRLVQERTASKFAAAMAIPPPSQTAVAAGIGITTVMALTETSAFATIDHSP